MFYYTSYLVLHLIFLANVNCIAIESNTLLPISPTLLPEPTVLINRQNATSQNSNTTETSPTSAAVDLSNNTMSVVQTNTTEPESRFMQFYKQEYKSQILSADEKKIFSIAAKKLYGPSQEKNAERFLNTCYLTTLVSNKMDQLINCYEQFLKQDPSSRKSSSNSTKVPESANQFKRSVSGLAKRASNPASPAPDSTTNEPSLESSTQPSSENSDSPKLEKSKASYDLSDDGIEKTCSYSFNDEEAKGLNTMYPELFYAFKKMKSNKGMCLGTEFGMCSGNDNDVVANPDILELNKAPPVSPTVVQATSPEPKNSLPPSSPAANGNSPTSAEEARKSILTKLEEESSYKFVSGKQIVYQDGLKFKVWFDTIRDSIGCSNPPTPSVSETLQPKPVL
ncbi:hypothetical protein AYI68_g5533 [Smittium mucronatum]|uniref:Uncharacterized protein n=1 Tax=Smittium mucronatum TaxID=133383 RepID=A0A1R0GU05_9FUNG|nr:hypothetical protein AYI68_g5533 [Smittium mucronatum]